MKFSVVVRALRNIVRIPGRSIMTGGILFVIITLVMIGLTVNAGSTVSIKQARKSLGNKVALQEAVQGMTQEDGSSKSSVVSSMGTLTTDIAKKLTESKLIEGYDYMIYCFADSKLDNYKPSGGNSGGSVSIGGGDGASTAQMKFRLVGNTDMELMEDFKNGTRTLLEGRAFTEEEVKNEAPVAVIDKRIAELNHLKPGSEIEITPTRKNGSIAAPVNVKVIGIFEDSGKDELIMAGMDIILRANTMFLPYTTLQEMNTRDGYREEGYLSSAYYYLKDPLDFNKFKTEAIKEGMDLSKYDLDLADNSFTKITGPMNKLSDFTKTGLIAIMVTGAFIMALLMTIIVRERKSEVGILRALGASRLMIALQFALESLILCSAAIILGIFLGGALSQGVADHFLQNEVTAQQKQADQNNVMASMDDVLNPDSTSDMIDEVQVHIGVSQIVQLTLTGIFICICGSITSIYWIMKYEPMKMLANRT